MWVLGDRRDPLLHLLQSHQMADVVGETGMLAWYSPIVHCQCSSVCRTNFPEVRIACDAPAQ